MHPGAAFANVAAAQTDAELVAAQAGKAIRVKQIFVQAGDAATTITFNTKGAGAGTAISPNFQSGVNGGAVLPYSQAGWFDTEISEALTVTTGAGSTCGILVMVEKV